MKAMILAAGYGTRLRPLTHTVPKPMVPILNRPMLEHTIHLLRTHGILDITVNLHHLPEVLIEHFGEGQDFGVQLHWSHEAEILGTAGGLKQAQKFLDGETFVVINSDVVTDIDLNKLITFHKSHGSALTLAVRHPESPDKSDPIEVDSDNRIVHMVGASSPERPPDAARILFTGIQVMEPEIFDRIPPNQFYGTTTDVFPGMLESGLPLFAYWHEGYWKDIGTIESYLEVHRDLLDGRLEGGLPLKESNLPQGDLTPPNLLGHSCKIADSAKIGPYVVIGNGCTIGKNAVIENTVCWEGVTLGQGSHVKDSALGNGVTTEENSSVENKILAQ